MTRRQERLKNHKKVNKIDQNASRKDCLADVLVIPSSQYIDTNFANNHKCKTIDKWNSIEMSMAMNKLRGPLELVTIVRNDICHCSCSLYLNNRRYNVVGDLMKLNNLAASATFSIHHK